MTLTEHGRDTYPWTGQGGGGGGGTKGDQPASYCHHSMGHEGSSGDGIAKCTSSSSTLQGCITYPPCLYLPSAQKCPCPNAVHFFGIFWNHGFYSSNCKKMWFVVLCRSGMVAPRHAPHFTRHARGGGGVGANEAHRGGGVADITHQMPLRLPVCPSRLPAHHGNCGTYTRRCTHTAVCSHHRSFVISGGCQGWPLHRA